MRLVGVLLLELVDIMVPEGRQHGREEVKGCLS